MESFDAWRTEAARSERVWALKSGCGDADAINWYKRRRGWWNVPDWWRKRKKKKNWQHGWAKFYCLPWEYCVVMVAHEKRNEGRKYVCCIGSYFIETQELST
jgi:hypothetical protein